MLDNHYRIAFAFQTNYDFQQQSNIDKMKICGRFAKQAVACIPTNRVRGYATHPTCGRRKP